FPFIVTPRTPACTISPFNLVRSRVAELVLLARFSHYFIWKAVPLHRSRYATAFWVRPAQ
ncbi:MAG TPA: hypothetical protein PLP28_15825, partial [Flavobacteriales bacterium]|nr:hypothetical protein [Flavobacteriales bacterium]